jgi:RNA recognition motif-containing protein
MSDTGTRLFVGGISWGVRDDALKAAFEQAGTVVSAVVIIDRMSGRSKGFGFVEMSTPEEAQAAIDMWHEKELDGRAIIVNIARPREERSF